MGSSPFPLGVRHYPNRHLFSPPRHVERSMQISRTPPSCSLCRKVYETQPIGGAFDPVRSPASTPHHPAASAFLFLYILCLRSCRLPSVFIRRPRLQSLPEELRNSWVPSLPLRPGALLTIPKMALSVGFIRFVFSTDTTQAKGLLTFTPVGLPPTEHVCLSWTHSFAKIQNAFETNSMLSRL